MKIQVKHVVILLLAMVVLHVFANLTGMYETRIIWIDKVLHVLAGIAIGMVWLIILQKSSGSQVAQWAQFMAIIGFVLLVAVTWEVARCFGNIFLSMQKNGICTHQISKMFLLILSPI